MDSGKKISGFWIGTRASTFLYLRRLFPESLLKFSHDQTNSFFRQVNLDLVGPAHCVSSPPGNFPVLPMASPGLPPPDSLVAGATRYYGWSRRLS